MQNDAAIPETCVAGEFPVTFGASGYRFGTESLSWYQARAACAQIGGHLVVVNNQVEQDFLTISMGFAGWLGASDHTEDGVFLWITGAALPLASDLSSTFRNWAVDQPDDLGNIQDCVRANDAGVWFDEDCGASFAYVCECDGVTEQPLAWCETGTEAHCANCGDACQFGWTCFPGQYCDDFGETPF